MPSRYWSILGLCLALASGEVWGQEQDYPNPSSQAEPGYGESFRAPFPVVIVQSDDDASKEQEGETKSDAHEAADLLAQQQAALAAERAAIAAERQLDPIWWSVLLSGVAAIVSVGALVLGFSTQWTIIRTSRAELRAYVSVRDFTVTVGEDKCPEITVNFKNTGNTPAYNLRSRVVLSTIDPPFATTIDESEPYSMFDLGADQGVRSTARWLEFGELFRQRKIDNNVKAWLHGVAAYRDVFGIQRHTWFKADLTVEMKDSWRFAIHVTTSKDGNRIT
jgi:hypothetical protein